MPKAMAASTHLIGPADGGSLYEQDEHQWVEAQISALAEGQLNRLDRPHLIEYLTEVTVRDRREMQSSLTVLLHHLLKLQFHPERLTRSWVMTILEQQSEIRSIIDNIPSLARQVDAIGVVAYRDALRRASNETGLSAASFPTESPWTLDEALTFDPPKHPAKGKRRQ